MTPGARQTTSSHGWTRPRSLASAALTAALLAAGCSADGQSSSEPAPTTTDAMVRTSAAPPSALATEATSAGLAVVLPGDVATGATVTALEQIGSLPLVVEIVTKSGGAINVGEGRDGEAVLDLPAFEQQEEPPRAFLRITAESPDSGVDSLAPGRADFLFGAEFVLDEESSGTRVDDGDNLMQRGLASDPSQYKLELDRGRPNCEIKGTEGTVRVQGAARVTDGRWYRVRCSRQDDTVTLFVTEFFPGGDAVETVSEETGPIGSVEWPRSETPLSVGGKLAANGGMIQSATDQFNGMISNPVLTIENQSE